MPILDGDGNARPDITNQQQNTSSATTAIKTKFITSAKATITPQYIVIHNTAGGTASSNAEWFYSGAGGSGNCTHFTVDDKEIWQCLKLNQKAQHIQGSNTSGGKGCKDWANKNAPALSQCGATNSNSIGIEVADGYNPKTNTYDESKVNMKGAVEMTIELTRYLMQQYNIPIENVVRHGDTHNKDCPMRIMQLGLWPYILEQCKARNAENKPVSFNPTTLDTSGQPSDGNYTITPISTGGSTLLDTPFYGSPTDIEVQLPDVDHRENTVNMDEVRGVSIMFYPPYNACDTPDANAHFSNYNYDRNYHYFIGKADPNSDNSKNEDDEMSGGEAATFTISPRIVMPRAYLYHVADGLCLLVQNENSTALIDCGEVNEMNKRGIISHIKGLGISKIDHLVITHFHSDHVGGFKDVAANFEIGNVYYKPLKTEKLPETEIGWKTDVYYNEFISICREKQINEYRLISDRIISDLGINLFVGDTSDNYNNYNRQSLSMIITLNGRKMFVGGDIITDTEKLILSKLTTCDTMIIAHHGYSSDTSDSNGEELLDIVNAQNYFIPSYSTTDTNQTKVVERINSYSSEFYSTHQNGKVITFSFEDDGITHDAKTRVTSGLDTSGDPVLPNDVYVGETKDLTSAPGFQLISSTSETKQARAFTDNDTYTYIDRALFQCKRDKHNITVAFMCPSNTEDYPTYEKALIEGLSILLHEHGLEVKDLWREFDLNRAPSPFMYLERDHWRDLLTEIEKQLAWRKNKYGVYTKTYTPYTAGSSGLSGGGTGSIDPGTLPGSGSTPSTPGTSPDIGGITDNERAVWTFFTGSGFSKECTAGIMGNLQQESGMDPNKFQSGGGKGRGIAQWSVNEDRHNGLIAYAKTKGKEWTDLQCQLEWIVKELNDNWIKKVIVQKAGSYEAWQTMTDIRKACDIFEAAFERAGIPAMEKRYKYAEEIYKKMSSTIPGIPDDELEVASLEDIGLEVATFTTRTSSTVFGWPLPGYSKVSSKFGPRVPPCKGASSYHGGIDVGGVPKGTPILAYASGTVVTNKKLSGNAGNYITLDHGNGIKSRYLHMAEQSPLAVGTQVAAGQEVGKVGSTGVGTGVHLHFEIWVNEEKKDPLDYVTPGGGSTGKMSQLGEGGTPNNGSTGGGTSPGTPGTPGSIGDSTNNLLYDDKKQENTNAVIGENSAGGQEHNDWGGIMTYEKGSPNNSNAEQPVIESIITQEMFLDIMEYADPSIIDDYAQDFEPYSKGLASIEDNQISTNDRANAMTKRFITTNENTFHYKVIESGPGSKDHCVTVSEELNYLAIPQDLKVEPIYPDLVIPPGYVSSSIDQNSPNSVPVAVIEEAGVTSSDAFTKQLSFDYDVLEGKIKQSNKTHHPVNYTDPYPYDDKITDLEKHYPKVFIDEIEGQLYSCNHPGCPISQPMAKNFAMVSDAMMNQSKRIEKRLTRIENILSTIIRNQGRMGARMNINCVYYGGHSTFNKYKCIRCLHDDRIHDGELVTIDQCLNCTRFEPILGQVYRILDDSGLNGSIILDDMQMSYTDLEGFRNLNDITHRSSKYFNAKATEEANCVKPTHTLTDLWKEADKQQAIETIKKESSNKANIDEQINNLKEEDYIFKMNWAETYFNSQEPDTKPYPNEGIVARQKVDIEGDGPETFEDMIADMDPVLDADVIEELKEKIKIRDNIWVDTRNLADSTQMNKYSSENYFFEDFNKVRIGKYGVKFSSLYNYNGEDYNNVYSLTSASTSGGSNIDLLNQNSNSAFASQVRDKIVEMAKKIYQDCVDGKAWYSQDYRTTEYDKPNKIKAGNGQGKIGYDCTSFVSCCYMYAGLKSMYAKSCSGGTLIREIQQNGKMIPCNKDNMQYILPGDILITASGTVTQNDCNQLKFFTSSHAAIYIGNNQIAHARGKNYGIQVTDMDYYLTKSNYVFVRPADLLQADLTASQQQSSSGGGSGVDETAGTINGKSYVAKIPQAVCTAYHGDGQGANGPLTYNAHCASHNIPYGTKVYIPELAGKAGDGVFIVQDTGGCFFDFDIYTTTWNGKANMDAYILEWGSSSKISKSYTWAMDLYNSRGTWNKLKSAWVTYKNMNGKLVNFLKYDQTDANIKNHPNYNS